MTELLMLFGIGILLVAFVITLDTVGCAVIIKLGDGAGGITDWLVIKDSDTAVVTVGDVIIGPRLFANEWSMEFIIGLESENQIEKY